MTKIEWAGEVWNPTVGCSRVSPGCEHCYAERIAHRGMIERHRGLTELGRKGPRWNGTVRFVPEALALPGSWRKPRHRVFVDSMSDLFHEAVSNKQIAAVFGAMASAPTSTFLLLTKRPERALRWFDWAWHESAGDPISMVIDEAHRLGGWPAPWPAALPGWPLRGVGVGVSVEDEQRARERLPMLAGIDASMRFVSYEPALEEVDFTTGVSWPIDWLIVGGESGPGARPFAIEWAHRTVARARAAGIPVFVKQLGSCTVTEERAFSSDEEARAAGHTSRWGWTYPWRHGKGGDPMEWPEQLRVRELPKGWL